MKGIGFATLALASALVVFNSSPALAVIYHYEAILDGPSESPPNASPGTGFAELDWDTSLNTMRLQASFAGLVGTTTASHIHAATAKAGTGTAGVATQTPSFTGFPIGVTSGTYDHTFDLTLTSTYNGSFVTANGGTAAGAAAALKSALDAGKAYLNIHTNAFPGGEIRGFMTPVPEPSTLALAGIGGMALLACARRYRLK